MAAHKRHVPHNKALHQTRRGGVAHVFRRGPVVEARLAGEGRCCAYGGDLLRAFALTALLITCGAAAAQPPTAVQPVTVPFAGPPVKAERALQVWALAGLKSQPVSVINELQATLMDPDKELRLAAAWALGHLRVKETDEEAVAYDEKPRVEKMTRPVYPVTAFYEGIQGVVRVEFVADEAGHVVHAEIRESIKPLDLAAIQCVKQWRFSPARMSGKAVPFAAVAPVSFRIGR